MNRRAIGWILSVAVGVYCVFISLVGRMALAYGYRAEAHSMIMLIRYLQPVLVLPFYLVALVPRKWATLPLWVLCLSIASLPFLIKDPHMRMLLGYWDLRFDTRAMKEVAMVMAIPTAVQIGVWLRATDNAL